jgi:SAM-dependent methyltransferase
MDRSPEMLARARTKLPETVEVRTHDLSGGLPYADGSFDRVVSLNCLYAVPDPQAALREMRRVLRPGGRFVFAHPNAMKPSGLWAIWREHWRLGRGQRSCVHECRAVSAFLRLVAYNAVIMWRARNHTYHAWSAERVRDEVVRAGFRVLEVIPRIYGETDALVTAEAV